MFDRPTTTALRAGQRQPRLLDQLHHPERRAGDEARLAHQQAADVLRVDAVDVLARIDREQHAARVDAGGQRQLDQDAVDARDRR